MHTLTHSYTHTFMHAYIHTYMHTLGWAKQRSKQSAGFLREAASRGVSDGSASRGDATGPTTTSSL